MRDEKRVLGFKKGEWMIVCIREERRGEERREEERRGEE